MSLPCPYGRKTLVHNWYEDRGHPGDVERDFPELRELRPFETDIANLSKSFSVLERITRCPAHKSQGTIADYGYREQGSSLQDDFQHPDKRTNFVRRSASVPQFVTTSTVPELVPEMRRPVNGPRTGYGAVLQRHAKDSDAVYFTTSSRDAIGYPKPVPGYDRSTFRASGIGVLDVADRGEGMAVGVLAGEVYKPDVDPSERTQVQRSWLYETDAALRNVAKYGGRKAPPGLKDNYMSLPLGEGGHRKNHATLVSLGGRLPRVSTAITTGKEKTYGINIFQDD